MTTKKANVKVTGDTRDAVRAMHSLRDSVRSVDKKLAVATRNANLFSKAALAAAAASAAMAAAQKAADFAKEAVKSRAVFDNLRISITEARKASGGLISDFDLAAKANETMRLGVVSSSKEFADLVQASTKLGLSVGKDATEAMDALSTAIARGSTLRLDDLGIVLSQSEAQERYAASLGRSASSLSDSEKKLAFQKIAMEDVMRAADSTTVTLDGQTATIARFPTLIDNMKLRFQGLDPVLRDVRDRVHNLTDEQKKSIFEYKAGRGSLEEYRAAMQAANVDLSDQRQRTAAANTAMRDYNATLKQQIQLQIARLKAKDDAEKGLIDRVRQRANEIEAEQKAADKAAAAEFEHQKRMAARGRGGGGGGRDTSQDAADATLAGQMFFAEQNKKQREAEEAAREAERDALAKHQDEMAKLREEGTKRREELRKQEEKRLAEHARKIEAIQGQVIQTTSSLAGGLTTALIQAGKDQNTSRAEAVKNFAGQAAEQLTAQAVMHGVAAAAWAAALNPVNATAEGIAAGIAGAGAAAMASTYGVSSAIAGGRGGGAQAAGPGNAFNLGGSSPGGFDDPSAPVSPLEEALGGSNPTSAKAGKPGGTTVIVEGSIVDGEKLMRIIQDQERNYGRSRA